MRDQAQFLTQPSVGMSLSGVLNQTKLTLLHWTGRE